MDFQGQGYTLTTAVNCIYLKAGSPLQFAGQMTKAEWEDISARLSSVGDCIRGGNLVVTRTAEGVNLDVATADDPPVLTPILSISYNEWLLVLADLQFPALIESSE